MGLNLDKGPTGRIRNFRPALAGLTREDVLNVLPDLSPETIATYGFSDSTDFDLLHDGRRFPPKAALGLAAARSLGRPLTADEFSGGERSACFAILRALDFEIAPKIKIATKHLKRLESYERKEISAIFEPEAKFTVGAGRWGISGIVEMPPDSGNFVLMVSLGKPREGKPYQDALTLDGRLIWESQTRQDLESPAIQKLILHNATKNNIHLFLRGREKAPYTYLGLLDYFSHDSTKSNPVHFVWNIQNWDLSQDDLDLFSIPVRPPLDPAFSLPTPLIGSRTLINVAKPTAKLATTSGKPRRTNLKEGKQIDWAERDNRNRQLGLEGEKLVLAYEVAKLKESCRDDLAQRVSHIALVDASAGYDIASFYEDGRSKCIEVKTTQGPAGTPFYISINEVMRAKDATDSFVIYRVFDHRPGVQEVKFFELPGDPVKSCSLEAISFRAYPGASSA